MIQDLVFPPAKVICDAQNVPNAFLSASDRNGELITLSQVPNALYSRLGGIEIPLPIPYTRNIGDSLTPLAYSFHAVK